MGEVAIVGGGIIGLACAWRLASQGVAVTLYDAAPEAREASWAAAGMLAPHHEHDRDTPLWRLCRMGLESWPRFLAQLGVGDAQVDYHRNSGLIPLLNASDEQAATERAHFLRTVGVDCRWLTREALPTLAPDITSVLAIPAAQVNPRLVTAILRQRCAGLGVRLRYSDPVSALDGTTLHSASGSEAFAQVVLASGAWTPALAALAGVDLHGEPVKGQLLRFAAPDGLLSGFIHSRHAYLVPRHGLGLVVGATMVTSGFDKSEDQAAIAALAAAARRLLPALEHAAIVETWTGLRPRLAHGLPVLTTLRPGLILATGHFRNGILLTPITAEIVAGLVLGRHSPIDLAPFAMPSP